MPVVNPTGESCVINKVLRKPQTYPLSETMHVVNPVEGESCVSNKDLRAPQTYPLSEASLRGCLPLGRPPRERKSRVQRDL
jgi:hypothetical protein